MADDEKPVALFYASHSGNVGHIVIRLDLNPPLVVCTCPAMRNIEARPKGCWAMVSARKIMGILEVE